MILFCGDPHGNFAHVINLTLAYRPAAVIFLGDMQAQRPLEDELAEILSLTEIYWIPGNHDTDSEEDYRNLFGSALADRNIHGRVIQLDGLRIAGLGGIFRSKVWMPPEAPRFRSADDYLARAGKGNRWDGGLPLRQRSTIFPDVYKSLADQQADILVTHEAPGAHPFGFPAIDELALRMGVKTLFHGHHHDRFQYAPSVFQAHAVGFCGVTDEAGNVIRAGDFDDERTHRKDWKGGGDRE